MYLYTLVYMYNINICVCILAHHVKFSMIIITEH